MKGSNKEIWLRLVNLVEAARRNLKQSRSSSDESISINGVLEHKWLIEIVAYIKPM
jgi:hypothetical protein